MTFTYRGGMLGKYRSASVGRVRQYSTAVHAASSRNSATRTSINASM